MATKKSASKGIDRRKKGRENDEKLMRFMRSKPPADPSASVAQIAKAIGVTPGRAKKIAERLHKKGLLVRSGSHFFGLAAASKPAPADSLPKSGLDLLHPDGSTFSVNTKGPQEQGAKDIHVKITSNVVMPQAFEVLHDVQRVLKQENTYGPGRADIALALVDAFLGRSA